MVESFNPDGRPTKYKGVETDTQVFKFALLGLTDAEMANLIDISVATFNNWKKDFPSFLESLNNGKEKADAEVAAKMYDKAIGAEWEEEQAFKVKDGKDKEKIVTVKVKKKAAPDTGAGSLWLSNRQRGRWKIKQDVTHSGDAENPIETINYDWDKLTLAEKLIFKKASGKKNEADA